MSIRSNTIEPGVNDKSNALKVLFQSLPDATVIIDIDGTVLDANPAAIEMYAKTHGQAMSANLYESLQSQPSLQPLLLKRKKMLQKVVRTGQKVSFEEAKGNEVMKISIYPVHASVGKVNKFIIIKQDVTNQKRAEAAHRDIDAQLNFTLEKCHIGAFSLDLSSHKISGTPEHSHIFGYTEMQPSWDFNLFLEHVIPEDQALVKDFFRNAITQLKPWSKKYRIRRTDGEIRWIIDIGDVEVDANGKPTRLLGLLRDITEQKVKAQTLKDLEQHWNFSAIHSHAGMWKIDLQKMILIRTPAHAVIYGEDYDTHPTWTVSDILDHMFIEDRERVKSIFDKAFSTQSDFSYDARIYRKDGALRWVHVIAAFQFDHAGQAVSIMWTTQDITEQKELEIKQKQMQEQLQQSQKLAQLGQLAGGIAHDFNNILAAIQINTEVILKETDQTNPLYQNLLSIIGSVNRSTDMIKQLLAFARKQPMFPKSIELDAELDKMRLMLCKLISANITLRWKLQCPNFIVNLDLATLTQIIINLCVNARDAISDSGIITIETKHIDNDECNEVGHIHGEVDHGWIAITVSDTGSGIEPLVLPHIFEPFFTTKAVGKGTGLGLSMVYGLVKQNNGHIICQTEVGKGTTFKICLPVVSHIEAGVDDASATVSIPETAGNGTVLVIEDEPEIGKIIKLFLEKEGFNVLLELNAENAIKTVSAQINNINLVITDIILPGMNGVKMSEELLKLRPNLRFLFMSGYSADALDQYGKFREDINFISKPFNLTRFVSTVHSILKKN